MADSIRELVTQSFETQMASITTANSYDINVKTVERARREFAGSELPAVGIFDGTEETTSQYNINTNSMNIAAELHSDAVNENRSIHANKMLASLKKAGLSGDTEHGGNAVRTHLASSEINIPQDDDNSIISVSATFTIVYEEVFGDPYSKP